MYILRIICGYYSGYSPHIPMAILDTAEAIPREMIIEQAQLGKKPKVKLGHVGLDGTKASTHEAMSYGWMKEKEDQLEAEARGNFSDPESRISDGPRGRDFQQSYNCQAVVGQEHQVILAAWASRTG